MSSDVEQIPDDAVERQKTLTRPPWSLLRLPSSCLGRRF